MIRRRHLAAAVLLILVAGGPSARAADEEEKPLKPENVSLRTADGVTLAATYYGSRLGKNAACVILLHASKGSRADFDELALKLQRAGHAVIAPDLRGHGAERNGELKPDEYPAMASQDVEAVKKFLLEKNNASELNIDKLCVVGVEMGADVAAQWAVLDWSWPPLATGKQGQDVKALVLVSPEWAFKTLHMHDIVTDPNFRSGLSLLIIAGKSNKKDYGDARRLYNSVERFHPAPSESDPPEKQTLYLRTPQTSLRGLRLIYEKRFQVEPMILKFIELRRGQTDDQLDQPQGPPRLAGKAKSKIAVPPTIFCAYLSVRHPPYGRVELGTGTSLSGASPGGASSAR